jgi:hypothetical protein
MKRGAQQPAATVLLCLTTTYPTVPQLGLPYQTVPSRAMPWQTKPGVREGRFASVTDGAFSRGSDLLARCHLEAGGRRCRSDLVADLPQLGESSLRFLRRPHPVRHLLPQTPREGQFMCRGDVQSGDVPSLSRGWDIGQQVFEGQPCAEAPADTRRVGTDGGGRRVGRGRAVHGDGSADVGRRGLSRRRSRNGQHQQGEQQYLSHTSSVAHLLPQAGLTWLQS